VKRLRASARQIRQMPEPEGRRELAANSRPILAEPVYSCQFSVKPDEPDTERRRIRLISLSGPEVSID
jgi:hypothetical protein